MKNKKLQNILGNMLRIFGGIGAYEGVIVSDDQNTWVTVSAFIAFAIGQVFKAKEPAE